MVDDHRRFSDLELAEFKNKFETHMKEENEISNRLIECQTSLMQKQHEMMHKQETLMKSIDRLNKSIAEPLEAWSAAQGAIKVGGTLGRFFKWAAGLAVLGGALTYIAEHMKNVS